MNKIPKISDAEWEIMNLIWEKQPISTNEIVEKLAQEKSWHNSTIRTLINRLVRKKALSFDTQGKQYLYRPLVPREECIKSESQSFVARVFGGAPTPMLAHLVKNTKLSQNDIQELKLILEEKVK